MCWRVVWRARASARRRAVVEGGEVVWEGEVLGEVVEGVRDREEVVVLTTVADRELQEGTMSLVLLRSCKRRDGIFGMRRWWERRSRGKHHRGNHQSRVLGQAYNHLV